MHGCVRISVAPHDCFTTPTGRWHFRAGSFNPALNGHNRHWKIQFQAPLLTPRRAGQRRNINSHGLCSSSFFRKPNSILVAAVLPGRENRRLFAFCHDEAATRRSSLPDRCHPPRLRPSHDNLQKQPKHQQRQL